MGATPRSQTFPGPQTDRGIAPRRPGFFYFFCLLATLAIGGHSLASLLITNFITARYEVWLCGGGFA